MDNIKQWFIERKIIYIIFALVYDGNINKALEIIRENELLQNFSNHTDNKPLSDESSQLIKEINENKNNNDYNNFISDDYQRLFVGPDESLAPLWESVYKTKDKLLFGDIELGVRRFYNSAGLDVKGNEPADYLPLQLSFMSRLCDIAEKDNYESIYENLLKQHEFLKEHLISWVSSLVEDINNNAEIKFWKCFSKITKEWLENDLDEIVKVINQNKYN